MPIALTTSKLIATPITPYILIKIIEQMVCANSCTILIFTAKSNLLIYKVAKLKFDMESSLQPQSMLKLR